MSPNYEPTITTVDGTEGAFALVPPAGCEASVVLRPVGIEDDHKIYAWWAVAGRYGEDQPAVSFNLNPTYDRTPLLRFDVPKTTDLTNAYLEFHLLQYLGLHKGKPPIIKNGDGEP